MYSSWRTSSSKFISIDPVRTSSANEFVYTLKSLPRTRKKVEPPLLPWSHCSWYWAGGQCASLALHECRIFAHTRRAHTQGAEHLYCIQDSTRSHYGVTHQARYQCSRKWHTAHCVSASAGPCPPSSGITMMRQ